MLGAVTCARGAEVTGYDDLRQEFTFTQDAPPWQTDEEICVVRRGEKIVCGKVIAAGETSATARITYRRTRVTRKGRRFRSGDFYVEGKILRDGLQVGARFGDRAPAPVPASSQATSAPSGREPVPPPVAGPPPAPAVEAAPAVALPTGVELPPAPPAPREVAAVPPASDGTVDTAATSEPPRVPMVNLSAGVNYIFPVARVEVMILPHVALGVMPLYAFPFSAGSGEISGRGLLGTVGYFGDGPFQGLWAIAGAGVTTLKFSVGGSEESLTSPMLMGAMGWRWYWPSGPNFGFAVGVNGLMHAPARKSELNFTGIIPSIVLDLGFAL